MTLSQTLLQWQNNSCALQQGCDHPLLNVGAKNWVAASDILMTLAEVSIALAGFGGIVAGLGYRSKDNWSSRDKFRLLVTINAI